MGGATGSVSWASGEPLIGDESVARALAEALAHGGAAQRIVDVVFVDDRTLAEMHGTFLGDPTPTDVITFDLEGDGDSLPGAAGDDGPDAELYVSVDMARRVALERGVSLERELCLYVVHGALHLCGYDDASDGERAEMRAAESAVLGRLGFPEDGLPHDR